MVSASPEPPSVIPAEWPAERTAGVRTKRNGLAFDPSQIGRQFPWFQEMITCALIASAAIALVLVVLVQGKWTSRDSWFAAVFASAVMAMLMDRYFNHIN